MDSIITDTITCRLHSARAHRTHYTYLGMQGEPLTFLHNMASDKIVSDTISCIAAICAVTRDGMQGYTLTLLINMASERIVSHTITRNAALSACACDGMQGETR